MKDQMLKKAYVFARKHGYDSLKRKNIQYKGYEVFEPIMKKRGGKVAMIGYPLFVLANENELRLSTVDECFEIRDILYPELNETDWDDEE